MPNLELQRKSLPNEPGIYLFKDKQRKVIYVGKAIDLKKRVSSYFLKTTFNDPYYEDKIKELVKRIYDIEYIVTENEKEALILENIQIKKHAPRFNVIMRDSKSYPWVCIFYSEDFPRIQVIRGPEKYSVDNMCIGPYTDKKEIVRILRDLRKIFPYCSCKKPMKKRKRPCIYHQIKLCSGPCISAIEKRDYLDNVNKIELFLKGETGDLKKILQLKMDRAAEILDFEMAAYWRDKLSAIDSSTTHQHVLLDNDANKDIIGYDVSGDYISMIVIYIREGRIINKSDFTVNIKEKVVDQKNSFPILLEQYYQNTKLLIPDIIIIPKIYNGLDLLQQLLKDFNPNAMIRIPKDDFENGLTRIANKNAKVIANQKIELDLLNEKELEQIQSALESAKELLDLEDIPRIIEGFDISNIEGTDATGSMVFFLEGKPYTQNYRHFKIKGKSTPDDVAMMKEVIERRYSGILTHDLPLPDLILVDGGKGQLNAGVSVLEHLGLNIPIIGLAKQFEEIYVPTVKEPIILPKNSPLLKLFQRIRDEAHRFAVRLHKKQRQKRMTESELDKIKGIGFATKKKLLEYFGSVDNIKKTNLDELAEVVGIHYAKIVLKSLK